MKTTFQTVAQAHNGRRWKIVDATGVPVGRLATEVASLIRGKHRPDFTPHVDGGDFVIVVNADKVVFTGRKLDQKVYYRHSGYIGGLKEEKASTLIRRKPELIVTRAVHGMLPKGALGHQIKGKLKVYSGSIHPHAAQQPEVYTLKYFQQ